MQTEYHQFLQGLKERIREAQQRAVLAVNSELLGLYWQLGAEITRLGQDATWGSGLLENLSKDLLSEFPGVNGFSVTNLKYMRQWYRLYAPLLNVSGLLSSNWPPAGGQLQTTDKQGIEFIPQVGTKLQANDLLNVLWGHHKVLIDKVKDPVQLVWYLGMTVKQGWSRSVLQAQIESNLYARQGAALNNFQHTLPAPDSDLAAQSLKNPYLFDFLTLGPELRERDLENALVAHLSKFLLELGRGFTCVGRQQYLNIDGDAYFPDLVFFHTRLKRYIVFELKVGDFKPEYVGKLGFYCETINEQLKEPEYEPTIGILLCKTPNRTVVEYALRGINHPMGVGSYQIATLPDDIKAALPSLHELEQEVNQAGEDLVAATYPEWKKKLAIIKSQAVSKETLVYRYNTVPEDFLQQDMELLVKKLWEVHESVKDLFITTRFDAICNGQYQEISGPLLPEVLLSVPNFTNGRLRELRLHYESYKTVLTSSTSILLSVNLEFDDTNYLVRYRNQELRKPYHHRITGQEANLLVDALANDLVIWIESLEATPQKEV